MAFTGNKSGRGPRKSPASGGKSFGSKGTGKPFRKKTGDGDSSDRKPYAKKEGGYGERKSYGEKKSYGDKPYGEKKSYGERKSYGDSSERKPYAKKEGGYGEKKSYGERKSYGDKPYGEKKSYGERKSYGDSSERKPYAKKEGGYGEKKSYGDKKPYEKKEGGYGERRSYVKKDSGYGDKPYGDKKPYQKRDGDSYERKPYTKKEGGSSYGERKTYGEKKSYGDKPYGEKKTYGERKSYGDSSERKPYAKKEGGYGEKKSYGDKPYGDKKPYEKKEGSYGERKSYGDKSYGEKKPYEKKEGSYGERKSYGDKSYGDKKPYEKKEGSYGERKSYGEKSYGEKKPYEKKEGSYGERKSYGDKSYGDKKPYEKKEGGYGEKKSYGDSSERRSYVKKDVGEGKSYAERKSESDAKKASRLEVRKSAISKRVNEEDGTWETFDEKTSATEFAAKKSRKRTIRKTSEPTGAVRLNRFIANTGLCSRREADELITAGVIKINGKIVTELGTKVQPSDTVHYGDQLLRRERKAYILINKPKDFITTTDDEEGRRTVLDLVDGAAEERLYPVGRLDRNTTGLLLLTNDGDIAERLMHPRYGIRKIYQVSLDRPLHKDDFVKIENGLELEDGPIKPDELSFVGDGDDRREVGIVIHSGRNRIVRRIFESLGYEVERLDRVSYAGLTKKDLPRGRWRHLTQYEVNMLQMLLGKKQD